MSGFFFFLKKNPDTLRGISSFVHNLTVSHQENLLLRMLCINRVAKTLERLSAGKLVIDRHYCKNNLFSGNWQLFFALAQTVFGFIRLRRAKSLGFFVSLDFFWFFFVSRQKRTLYESTVNN